MRGEYINSALYRCYNCGSPPHAWGILKKPGMTLFWVRFTPTCVGNIVIVAMSFDAVAVHPHMRGEYFGRLFRFIGGLGSPPHAWGIYTFPLI